MSPGSPDESPGGLIESILQSDAPEPDLQGVVSELLAFLVADIRGYTSFTQAQGDEAAAKLTAKFAMVVRELVARFDGTVFELRGDEALCVFRSPRQALRLAAELQQRFVEETVADPDLPLTVGIGVDAGEAVHGEDGYRGGALNLAARLCSRAKAGEVLCSPEVAHLARAIDGQRYVRLERVAFKGLSEPIRPMRVVPDGEDPAQQLAALIAARGPAAPTPVRWLPGPLGRHPRRTLAGAVAIVLVASALVAVIVHKNKLPGLEMLAENSIGVVDPADGHLVRQLHIDGGPTALATGFGSVWAVARDNDTVVRIDPTSGQLTRTVDVGASPSAIAIGPDSAWVTNSAEATVSRIDLSSNKVVATIPVGSSPAAVTVAHDGTVWVANTADGTVSVIDPSDNRASATVSVGDSPSGIAAGTDIWVANATSNSVTQIDARTHESEPPIPVGKGPHGIAVIGDTVWVTCSADGTVWRIPTSGASVEPAAAAGVDPTQVAAVGGHVWIVSTGDRVVLELDPDSGKVLQTLGSAPTPAGLASAGGKLWVAATTNPTRHSGGTLRLVSSDDVIWTDPLYGESQIGTWLGASSYDALVGFRRSTGADGTAIVSDLAAEIPRPSEDNRTYTFRLREGIRWSTGKQLTVDEVRRGIQRAVVAGLLGMIEGADGCTVKACAISGVETNAANSTVKIRLAHPSGDFLNDLAFAPAVPVDTPLEEQKTPLPATGPYQVAQYVPTKFLRLVRNKNFHEWSAAAQPLGHPDAIEWRKVASDDAAADLVETGEADWADVRFAGSEDALLVRYKTRLHSIPAQTTHALFLNTRSWPFENPHVRRALAYALDRGAVARAWPDPGKVACQMLPKNFPGYRPSCPFTLHPDASGAWTDPDFRKALQEIAELPRPPDRTRLVTVFAPPEDAAAFGYVAYALNQLGFRATVHAYDGPENYFSYVADSRHNVQAGFFGLVAGGGTANEFLGAVYRCDAFHRNNQPFNLNTARFCDHAIDQQMDDAAATQADSPAEGNAAWHRVDEALVSAAPWIPLVTPSWEDAVSPRVRNYQRNSALGPLFDQMWVV